MNTTIRYGKTAKLVGCIACIIASLSFLSQVVTRYLLLNSDGWAETTFVGWTSFFLTIGALIVGIPLGVHAYFLGRKGLGLAGIILCVLSVVTLACSQLLPIAPE